MYNQSCLPAWGDSNMLEPIDFFLQDGLKLHCIEGYCFMKTILFVSHHCPTNGLKTFCKPLLKLENKITNMLLWFIEILAGRLPIFSSTYQTCFESGNIAKYGQGGQDRVGWLLSPPFPIPAKMLELYSGSLFTFVLCLCWRNEYFKKEEIWKNETDDISVSTQTHGANLNNKIFLQKVLTRPSKIEVLP